MLGRCNTVLCRVERKTRAGWKEKITTTSHGALCAILGSDEYIGYNFGKTKFTIMVGHSWRMEVDSKLAKWCHGQMVDAPGQGPVGQVTLMDAHMELVGGHDPEHSKNVVGAESLGLVEGSRNRYIRKLDVLARFWLY